MNLIILKELLTMIKLIYLFEGDEQFIYLFI
jgi:hypothetical protein